MPANLTQTDPADVIRATFPFQVAAPAGKKTPVDRALTACAARADRAPPAADHRKESTALSHTDQSSTTQTRSPMRRAGATAALASVGMATAALSVGLAPLSTSASADATWALPSEASRATLEPVMVTAEDRAALAGRSDRSSRSAEPAVSLAAEEEAEPEVVGTRYTTTALNVRKTPEADAKVVAVLDPGTKVKITDEKDGGYRQIVYKDKTRWVSADYLSKSKPKPKPAGPSSAPCASGSGVEGGLTANAISVHRAVCNAFPSVTTYGGVRGGGGAHGSGRALDIMVTGSTGDQIASYVRANAKQLGVSEVIWAQKIWTVQRSGDGWRWMSDRGSATANHYDHVHVTTY
jgi:uncharacterized protein YgiM (DUF1202 family)